MEDYSVQDESKRIFFEHLLGDKRLALPSTLKDAARRVKFVGKDPRPFVPTPSKITESASALLAFIATAANTICVDRYGVDYQDVEVNTDLATLFLEAVILPTVSGKSFLQHPGVLAELKKGDIYNMNKPIHQEASNLYQTKDGKWYYLHGDFNATVTMGMLGVEEQDVTREEAISIYAGKVAQHDAAFLESKANDELRQSGVTCLTFEEFLASEQGKAMGTEPLWTTRPKSAPRSSWPHNSSASDLKPLSGIRVIDFSRALAAPVISKVLAVLGAEVIKVTNKDLPDMPQTWMDLSTGKKDADIDLTTEDGRAQFTELVAGADVLIDGYRPGVLARLGFSSDYLRTVNERLVSLRENCYGFKGPLASRSGWQQISDCLVGHSWLQGKFLGLDEPVLPPLPNSDYQTGLIGAAAVLVALLERTKSEQTFDIDISLTQYNIWYYRLGQYSEEQCEALRSLNEGFQVRHYDNLPALVFKSHAAFLQARPDLFKDPSFFWDMSGKEWGLGESIKILAPPFKLSMSKLEYTEPSGRRGRSKPEWTAF